MSLDESQEEDCTVYIEELKSDNPSLKLNAASKIAVIGAVLGTSLPTQATTASRKSSFPTSSKSSNKWTTTTSSWSRCATASLN